MIEFVIMVPVLVQGLYSDLVCGDSASVGVRVVQCRDSDVSMVV